MAIDLRAKTYCNLGTIISGDFADDYLQNSGLIKTVGNLKLDGIHTPAVGTQIYFAYEKNGNLTRLPRVMRVLSSFADPYRNTTDISMGCLLSLLDQLKPPPTTFENEAVIDISIPPVSASTLADWVCTQIGLAHGTFPLTNTYALNRLTPDNGFIALLSDLLVSESYVGYLDETETLRFIDLSNGSTFGPLLSNQEVIDVGAIGAGQLPAQSVVVNYSSLRFKPPDPFAYNRDWELDESLLGANYTVAYTQEANNVTSSYNYNYYYTNLSRTQTFYDGLDRVFKRVETRTRSLGEVNGQWVGAAMSGPGGGGQFYATQNVTTTVTTISEYVSNNAADYPYCNMVKRTTTSTEEDLRTVAGTLGINTYRHPQTNALATLPSGTVVTSRVVQDYDTIIPATTSIANEAGKFEDYIYNTGSTKQKTSNYASSYQTLPGQQSLRRRLTSIENAAASASSYDWQNAINSTIYGSAALSLIDSTTQIVTNREFGLEKRPSLQDRLNSANRKGPTTENKAELQWVYGSPASTSYIEFSMPLASDDQIVNGAVITSDAGAKALRFGRAQNGLLLGNRNGMNMQLTPELLPAVPFAPLYFTANGATAQYRANANSWTFDASGLVCSTDALFWGGITGNNNFWYPTAPNTTSISISATPAYNPNAQPANTITTPANFDPTASDWISTLLPTNESPTFPTSVTPAASAAPYIQTITLTPTVQVGFNAARFDYPLAFTRTPAPTPLQLVNSFTGEDVRYPVPTPLRLSVGTLVVMDMAEEDNFYGSWSQQNYDWNAYLRPGKWGA